MGTKVIEVRVRVLDIIEDDKFEEDIHYEPQTICLSYEQEGADYVYTEADEITDAINRVVCY